MRNVIYNSYYINGNKIHNITHTPLRLPLRGAPAQRVRGGPRGTKRIPATPHRLSAELPLEGEPLLYRYYSNVSHFSFLTLSGNEKRLRNVMEPPLYPPRTRPAVGADFISARLLCLLLAGRICNGMPGKYIGSFQGILNDTLKLQMYLPMGN